MRELFIPQNPPAFLLSILLVWSEGAALAQDSRHVGFCEDVSRQANVPLARPVMRGGAKPTYPGSISLKEFMPRPGDQGGNPTDAAWAVAYAALTCMRCIDRNPSFRAAPDSFAFSPGFVTAVTIVENHTTCEKGVSLMDALEVTLRVGTVYLREFPFECQMTAPPWLKRKASQNRISAYYRLFDRDDQDKINAIKQSLVEKRPVVAGLRYVPSFLYGDDIWRPSPEELNRGSGGNDTAVAITVVGYDDMKLGGALELMASLGEGWGKGGFAEISYESFNKLCLQAFIMYADSTIGSTEAPSAPIVDSLAGSADLGFSATLSFLDESRAPNAVAREKDLFRFVRPWQSNQIFRIQVALGNEGYVYAFTTDSASSQTELIYPDKAITLNNYWQRDTLFMIPDPSGRSYCMLDSTTGTDYVCLLFARKQLDVKAFCHDMEYVSGSVLERIVTALSGDCVPAEEIQSTEGGTLTWWTLNKDKSYVALIFALTHIGS